MLEKVNADSQIKAWWHVSNVNAIARETTPVIVERLTGVAPASDDVAEAVSSVLKTGDSDVRG